VSNQQNVSQICNIRIPNTFKISENGNDSNKSKFNSW